MGNIKFIKKGLIIIILLVFLNTIQISINNEYQDLKSDDKYKNELPVIHLSNLNYKEKLISIVDPEEIKIIKTYNCSNWGSIASKLGCYNYNFILYDRDTHKYKEFSIKNGSFLYHLPRTGSLPPDLTELKLFGNFIYAGSTEIDGVIYKYKYPSFQKTNEFFVSNIYFKSRNILPLDNNFWIIQSPNPYSTVENYYLHCRNMETGAREYYSIYLGNRDPYSFSTDNKRIFILYEDYTLEIFGIDTNEYCVISLPIEEFFAQQDRFLVVDFDFDGRYFWFNEMYSVTLFALDILAIAGLDYDNDGLIDADELDIGTNTEIKDTDNDTMIDGFEIQYGLDPLDPADGNGDLDNDGLTNSQEIIFGSDPTIIDSDNDGLTDYQEYKKGCDPNNNDSDGDGLIDGEDPRPAVPIRWWEIIGISWPVVILVTVIFSFWFRKHHYNNS